jgi:hypothetical protein
MTLTALPGIKTEVDILIREFVREAPIRQETGTNCLIKMFRHRKQANT